MHFVAALDSVEGMRCVPGLFEGSCNRERRTAMRASLASQRLRCCTWDRGWVTGLANIHNARRGQVPMVNIVGDHATYHLQYDTPPTSNIAAVAAPMSDWVHTGSCAEQVAQDAAAAVAAAKTAPGQIATLILPADACWSEGSQGVAPMPPIPHPKPVNRGAIEGAVKALRSGEPCMLVLGGPLSSNRLETASRVANSVGSATGL